jgi:hypothetical protein
MRAHSKQQNRSAVTTGIGAFGSRPALAAQWHPLWSAWGWAIAAAIACGRWRIFWVITASACSPSTNAHEVNAFTWQQQPAPSHLQPH